MTQEQGSKNPELEKAFPIRVVNSLRLSRRWRLAMSVAGGAALLLAETPLFSPLAHAVGPDPSAEQSALCQIPSSIPPQELWRAAANWNLNQEGFLLQAMLQEDPVSYPVTAIEGRVLANNQYCNLPILSSMFRIDSYNLRLPFLTSGHPGNNSGGPFRDSEFARVSLDDDISSVTSVTLSPDPDSADYPNLKPFTISFPSSIVVRGLFFNSDMIRIKRDMSLAFWEHSAASAAFYPGILDIVASNVVGNSIYDKYLPPDDLNSANAVKIWVINNFEYPYIKPPRVQIPIGVREMAGLIRDVFMAPEYLNRLARGQFSPAEISLLQREDKIAQFLINNGVLAKNDAGVWGVASSSPYSLDQVDQLEKLAGEIKTTLF